MANELNIKNGFISNNNSIIQGSLSLTGNIISTTGSTYDIGTSVARFRNIYASGDINSSNNLMGANVWANSIKNLSGSQILFTDQSASAIGKWYTNTGNLQIGYTASDTGYRLDVIGTTRLNGLQTLQGTIASDTAPLGSELAGTASGTNWTGTSFATGYTHTTGSIVDLSSTLTATIGVMYRINTTITNQTTGSIALTFGGVQYYSAQTITRAFAQQAVTTGPLIITPTTDFNGTIVLNIQVVNNSSAITTFKDSTGNIINEIRGNADNLFIGVNSGMKSTILQSNSLWNTHIGHYSGVYSVGRWNTSVGEYSMYLNTVGSQNSALGYGALWSNIAGGNNTAVGHQALTSNTYGQSNTAFGGSSMFYNTTGSSNTVIGQGSLLNNTIGTGNIAIGVNAGSYISGGTVSATILSSSIMIGSNTRPLADNQANQIVISGYTQTGLGDNTIVLGNTATAKTAIYGRTLFGTTTDDGVTQVQITGSLRITNSTNSAQYNILTTDTNGYISMNNIVYTAGIGSGSGYVNLYNNYIIIGSLTGYAFSSTANAGAGSQDTGLRRNNVGVLEIYNGITADGNLVNRRDLLVRTITASTASITGTNPTPLIVERTGGSNANIQFKNDAGIMYAGARTGTSFGIGSTQDLATTSQLTVFGNTGNVVIQNGGSPTDTGYRLDVSGTTRLNGQTTVTGGLTASTLAVTAVGATAGLTRYLVSDNNGNVFYQPGVGEKGATGSTGLTGPIYDASLAIAYSVVFG